MAAPNLPNGISGHGQPNGLVTVALETPSSWVIQKFGGTSVGKFAVNIVDKVVRLAAHRVAIVCSARSSSSKLEGTTNRLLRASREAKDANSEQYKILVDNVQSDHIQAAEGHIKSPELLAQLKSAIERECVQAIRLLEAARTLGEISPRSIDKVMSVGEKLSCIFMAALLEDHGVESEYVDLADIISIREGSNLDQQFYDELAEKLGQRIEQCGNKVPVITGYFGTVPGGLLDKIGRGYTDLCAALAAVGIKAQELQVWKEVDGIFTADPRKVPTARLLSAITPAEAAELTFYGSEVIHPFTMEQVIRARIPIRIKNVMNPRGAGTIIFPDSAVDFEKNATGQNFSNLIRSRSSSALKVLKGPKRPTAVTIKRHILVINVHSNKRSLSHGFFAKIFSTLDKWRLSIDLISTSEVHVSMALHSEAPLLNGTSGDGYQIVDEDLKGAIRDLRGLGTVDIIPEMAILSLVGKQMKNMVGIAGKMFSTLGEHNVNIEMISQGASEINISCVIEERDADRAINILHTNIFTFLEQ
ncbi:putative aspartokinase [Phaeomoniella chlamydospora]|uniref:Aspartokinase n=1 Tax=Phaeomoniella chlamydospora TaxID=158046 RepID=A0A0G2H1P2_PHACM|nr:putative aspartokinase [Phaeomoniella chlamydospora]